MKFFCISYLLKRLLCFLLPVILITKTNAQLTANFTASVEQGCSPLVVQFTDLSTGNPNQWFWDLGNGATSTQQNPGAIYINPGKYTITLTVKNGSGQNTVIKNDFITVYANPAILFSATPIEGCAPLDVNFSDNSSSGTGNITNWIWDFGDGITSTSQNPLHTYSISDTFNVTLSVVNSFGCRQTLQQKSLIKVGSLVKSGFIYSYTNACKPPATVTFTNTSSSNGTLTYQWFFGDGSGSTLKDPVHVYATSGNFAVKLVARNESGCMNTSEQVISIGSAEADFNYTSACVNEPVVFTDTSAPRPISEIWDFGDGTTDTGLQVMHVYNTAGSYQVTLLANFGGCTDVIRKTIRTGQKPTADFTATGNRSTCNYPVTIQFNNTSIGATNYKWLFGDGTASGAANPTHTYNTAGSFSVTLIAFNSNGCPDTITRNNFVELGPPVITGIENIPFEGCAPQTILLRAQVNSPDPITVYQWSFGDGGTSTDSVPRHTYNQVGTYTVKLIVTTNSGCADTLTIVDAVSLGRHPNAALVADPLKACAETEIQFTDSSKGLITDWYWDFGDGGTSTEQNPKHKYLDTGYFTIMLIVSEYGCSDTITRTDYVYLKPPVARFGYNGKCSDPFMLSFIDSSIAPETWLWDFGDGGISNLQNPSHTYTTKGSYPVFLTVTNGNCSYTKYDTVDIIHENPSFDYKPLQTNFCKYDSVRFFVTKYQASNIKSFYWDFGDGITTGYGINYDTVYHLYTYAGTYTPLLIVKDMHNCTDTVKKNIQLSIYGPTAAFSNKSGDCVINTVSFTDESLSDGIHPITTWIWNYGDSSKADTLKSAPFIHSYSQTGLYTVSLKVIDNNGCIDTVSNANAVYVTQPRADFAADTLSCSGSYIQFIDSSYGVSVTYKWNFGDGKFSVNPEPLHAYVSEGVYNVQLIITDKYGCTDTMLKPMYIRVADPVTSFILPDSLFLCPPARVEPQNTSKNYTSLLWNFGDGNTSSEINPVHYYTSAGNYNLLLIAQGYGNCIDTISKPLVLRGPQAELFYDPFTGCNPLNISFSATAKNTIQYIWDFGDGVTQTTSDTARQYIYTKPGRYIPQLVIVDSGGCRVPIVNTDTIIVFGVDPKFTAQQNLNTCDFVLINFTDSSKALFDNIASFHWNFGDGDTSILQNPFHYYLSSNIYNPILSVETQKGCLSTYQIPVNIKVDSTPKITAFIPDSACMLSSVALSAISITNLNDTLNWFWNMGNGDILNNQSATYSYSSSGIFTVKVIAANTAGCADTVQQPIRIDLLPLTDAGYDSVICLGESVTLKPGGADVYNWLADGSLSCTNCTNPTATPLKNAIYFVTGINNYGCKAGDSVRIEVKQPSEVSVIAPDTVCQGNTIQLKASGEELYSWLPLNAVTNATGSQTSSTPYATTTYSVIGTDPKGCFSDTASITVHVFPYPVIQLPDSLVTIEAGTSYKIDAAGSEDIIFWQWSPLTGLSCTNCIQPVAKPKLTTTYTVKGMNIAGCTTEKNITITVLCKNQNLFVPNTFSPNGDGMNDCFYPRGKGLFTIKSLRIFSRWGNIVFERMNFPPNEQSYGWNGTYQGKVLHPDVYVFVMEVVCDNGAVISSKGNITLLR